MNFVFRPSTKKGRYPGSLSLRLIHNRQPRVITLASCSVYSEEWDKESQTILFPADDPSRTAALQEVETLMKQEADVIRKLVRTLGKRGRYTLDELLETYRPCLPHRHTRYRGV